LQARSSRVGSARHSSASADRGEGYCLIWGKTCARAVSDFHKIQSNPPRFESVDLVACVPPVSTENVVRIDLKGESLNDGHDGRADNCLLELDWLAAQVQERT
jgi:hypothetical protein